MVLRLSPALKVAIWVAVLIRPGSCVKSRFGSEAFKRSDWKIFLAFAPAYSKSGHIFSKPSGVSGRSSVLFNSISSLSGIKPMQIYPGSSWGNGYNKRSNGTLRKELLNAEWFHTTRQAQVVINAWLRQYNQIRPHHALNMKPPLPETLLEKTKISFQI